MLLRVFRSKRLEISLRNIKVLAPVHAQCVSTELQAGLQVCPQHRKLSSERPSYFNCPGTEPLVSWTVGDALDMAADKRGDKEAVVMCHQNIRRTFSQLRDDADKLATGLLALGMQRGERIGIWGPNTYEWLMTQYAAAKAGLILVTINPSYEIPELAYCLQKVGIKTLVAAERYKQTDYYKMLLAAVPPLMESKLGAINYSRLPDLKHVIMISDKDYPGTHKFQDIVNAGGSSEMQQLGILKKKIQFGDPCCILFTSGTTGSPKGATLSHHSIVNDSYFSGKRLELNIEGYRMCNPLPLFHVFGCVGGSLGGILHGSCIIYPSATVNAKATAEAIHKERCNLVFGTPTMYIDILELEGFEKYDFSNMTIAVVGASSCSPDVFRQICDKIAKGAMIGYGATELSCAIMVGVKDDPEEKRATTVGRVLDQIEIKVVDLDGNIVPCGTTGELWARGYVTMLGYWNDDTKTAEAFTKDRWYKTGDMVTVDENGYTKIIGRSKDMIIRGGENIYPIEIEDFLHTHPQIIEAQVFGVTDKRLGEEVCAWLRTKPDSLLTKDQVRDFCKGQLSYFKIPRHIFFVDEFPVTATGKAMKIVMRKQTSEKLGISAPS